MKKPDLMNDQKKAVIWEEWGNGSPMVQFARVIEKPPATVFSYLRYHGVLHHGGVRVPWYHCHSKNGKKFPQYGDGVLPEPARKTGLSTTSNQLIKEFSIQN